MKEITLYSTGCPRCQVLKKKLDAAGINYKLVTNEQIMLELGFQYLPVLKIDGSLYDFTEAVKMIKELELKNGN